MAAERIRELRGMFASIRRSSAFLSISELSVNVFGFTCKKIECEKARIARAVRLTRRTRIYAGLVFVQATVMNDNIYLVPTLAIRISLICSE